MTYDVKRGKNIVQREQSHVKGSSRPGHSILQLAHPGVMEVSGGLYLVHVYLCLALLQLQLLMQPGHPLQELHHSAAALLAPRAPEI